MTDQASLALRGKLWFVERLHTIESPRKPKLPERDAEKLAGQLFQAFTPLGQQPQPADAGELIPPGAESVYQGTWAAPNRGEGGRRRVYDRTWNRPWPHATPFVFGIGVLQDVSADAGGNNRGLARVVVHVQSPHPLRNDVCDAIRAAFDAWCHGLVSVRFMSPAVFLRSNPNGEWKPWNGPRGPRFAVGAPVAIAAGGVGALTLLLKWEGKTYGLTAGHVISDGGAGEVGTDVYCPPVAEPNSRLHFGRVHRLVPLPRRPLLAAETQLRGVKTQDLALIAVEDQALPEGGAARKIAKGSLHSGTIPAAEPRIGDHVVKVAARTKLCEGVVRATGFYLEIQDCANALMLFATDLIAIELEGESQVMAGDSGALVYRLANGVNEPVAMVVAGARQARLGGPNSRPTQVAYAMPLARLDLPPNSELV